MTQPRRVDRRAKVQDERLPWEPLAVNNVEIAAAKEFFSPDRKVLADLLIRVSGAPELEFRPEGERASAFASGKRWVLLELSRIARLPIVPTLDKE